MDRVIKVITSTNDVEPEFIVKAPENDDEDYEYKAFGEMSEEAVVALTEKFGVHRDLLESIVDIFRSLRDAVDEDLRGLEKRVHELEPKN